MAYDAQVAGVGDNVPGRPARSQAVRAMQAASLRELAGRLPEVVAAVRAEVEAAGGRLELVNAGGTGSLDRIAANTAVTELSAGSGLYAPTLFDTYRSLALRPAALFALPVVRRPAPGVVTVLGGGYVASGPAGRDRLPSPVLPAGLRLTGTEGAGEVQTPAAWRRGGPAADRRPGLVPAHQGGRAVRAVRPAAAHRGRRGGGRGADLPRGGQGLRMTRADLPEPTTDAGRAGLAALLAEPAQALLGLDFDGTLAPIVPDPDAARGHPGVPRVLTRLAAAGSGWPWSPAGRPPPRWSTPASPTCPAWSCSGTTAWSAGRAATLTAPEDLSAVDEARRRLPEVLAAAGAPEGTYVEDKGAAVAVHTRRTADPVGGLRRAPRAAGRAGRRGRAGGRAGPVRARAAAGRRRQGRRAARPWSPSGPPRWSCSSATTSATWPPSTRSTGARRRDAGPAGVQRVDRGDRARRPGRPRGRRPGRRGRPALGRRGSPGRLTDGAMMGTARRRWRSRCRQSTRCRRSRTDRPPRPGAWCGRRPRAAARHRALEPAGHPRHDVVGGDEQDHHPPDGVVGGAGRACPGGAGVRVRHRLRHHVHRSRRGDPRPRHPDAGPGPQRQHRRRDDDRRDEPAACRLRRHGPVDRSVPRDVLVRRHGRHLADLRDGLPEDDGEPGRRQHLDVHGRRQLDRRRHARRSGRQCCRRLGGPGLGARLRRRARLPRG